MRLPKSLQMRGVSARPLDAAAGLSSNTSGSAPWLRAPLSSVDGARDLDNRDLILAAFETSYEPIARYIALRIGERDQAEDLASDVFVKALKNAGSYKPGDKPIEAWLFRIAHNVVVDHLRRRSRRSPSLPLDEAVELASDDQSMDNILRIDDVTELRDALSCLTDSERQVVAMRFTGEMSPPEIAEALGKSPGAVRWLQHSAITKLRERLGEAGAS